MNATETVRSDDTVVSADGTTIAWHRSGEGPPAVLLHGTSSEKAGWAISGPFLGAELELHAVDRRGRGRSGLGEPYDVDREVEDVAAVVAAVGEPVHLIGHSFGALLALAAAAAGVPVRSLVLYEPPLDGDDLVDAAATADTCDRRLAAGDPEGCLRAFYGMIGEEHAVDVLRAVPGALSRFLRDAHTIPRELRGAGRFTTDLATGLEVPVLILAGAESHELFRRAARRLAAALPAAEFHEFEGQGHLAQVFAPEVFAGVVLEYVRRH